MAAFNRLSGTDFDQITQDAQHTQAVDAQFIGAISKTKMLIVAFDGLKDAGNLPAHFKPSNDTMSILVFEIAPINCARVLRPPSPHSCQDRMNSYCYYCSFYNVIRGRADRLAHDNLEGV